LFGGQAGSPATDGHDKKRLSFPLVLRGNPALRLVLDARLQHSGMTKISLSFRDAFTRPPAKAKRRAGNPGQGFPRFWIPSYGSTVRRVRQAHRRQAHGRQAHQPPMGDGAHL